MNTRLNDILHDNWLKVTTWHTGHYTDNERFHSAIEKVYAELGYVSFEDLLEIIQNNTKALSFEKECIEYAKKASCILEFLNDSKNILISPPTP